MLSLRSWKKQAMLFEKFLVGINKIEMSVKIISLKQFHKQKQIVQEQNKYMTMLNVHFTSKMYR